MIVYYGTGRDIFLILPLPSSVPVILTWAMARQVFNFLSYHILTLSMLHYNKEGSVDKRQRVLMKVRGECSSGKPVLGGSPAPGITSSADLCSGNGLYAILCHVAGL